MQMGEPAGIGFLVDQDIVGLRRAEAMVPDLHRPVVVVELDVEEAFGIRAPDHAAVALLHEIVVVAAAVPFAHPDREIFRALDVGAPGDEPVVGRMPAAAEPEIVVCLGELIAVEHDMALAAVPRHAAEQLVLSALAEFAEIGKRTVRRGHAGIVFLDPPAHLLDQCLLQESRVAEQAVGIGVLRFKILPDVGIKDLGVAQHLLPVLVLQPGIVVGHGNAVAGKGMRPARRDRGGLRGYFACCLGHLILDGSSGVFRRRPYIGSNRPDFQQRGAGAGNAGLLTPGLCG